MVTLADAHLPPDHRMWLRVGELVGWARTVDWSASWAEDERLAHLSDLGYLLAQITLETLANTGLLSGLEPTQQAPVAELERWCAQHQWRHKIAAGECRTVTSWRMRVTTGAALVHAATALIVDVASKDVASKQAHPEVHR